MRAILVVVLLGLLGVASLGVGIVGVLDTEVTCGIRIMSPGDTCTSYQKSRLVVSDYEGQEARNDLGSFFGIGFGTFFLLISTAILMGLRRHRRLRQQGVPGHIEQRARTARSFQP